MGITDKALAIIKTDSNLRAKLMLVEGRSEYTIKRWIEHPDQYDDLTKPKYVFVIQKHTGLKEKQIVEKQKAHA